jgi:hypothetical protein
MSNPNQSELDYNQAMKRCIDSGEDAIRVQLATATGMAIELSAADGDNILALRKLDSDSAAIDSLSSGSLVSLDMSNSNEAQMMVAISNAITGTCTLELDVSPNGADWFATGVTLAVTGSGNVKSSKLSDLGQNVRVRVVSNTISAGDATVHLMIRS